MRLVMTKTSLLAGVFAFMIIFSCSKRPSEVEIDNLEQARKAADAAQTQVQLLELELKQLKTRPYKGKTTVFYR